MPQIAPDTMLQNFVERADPSAVAPRLARLREVMVQTGIDAFLVPRADAHRGEAVPASEARLAWLTGFTGSAGMAIVGRDRAVLLVDGRYTLQAPKQTDTALVAVAETPPVSPYGWIRDNLPEGAVIAFDPWLHTAAAIAGLKEKLTGHATLKAVENPIDRIWTDRPAPPQGPVEFLGVNRAGKPVSEKLAELQRTISAADADTLVLTLPESICWLFNMRGRDVPNTPFVLGFAIVPEAGTPELFLPEDKLTAEARTALAGVAVLAAKPAFADALAAHGAKGETFWIDADSVPEAVADIIGKAGGQLVKRPDPVVRTKARKNDAELAGMREAHIRDGVALARFLCWFDSEAAKGQLTEIGIVRQLEFFRKQDETLTDVSFDTIAGAGPNAAIPHYRVTEKSDRRLSPGQLMLVDSGGQYLSGTTDVTRTLFTGSATDEQKDRYTRVLKGMIAISRLRFPRGTTGAQIDVLARQYLWAGGVNYNHGTGHGVGAFLSVHEGPVGIAPRYTVPFEPGNIVSNEPGFYKEDHYGIRIENLVHVVESPEYPGYFEFETLTLAPIDTRLIDLSLLGAEERDWLNAYHRRVRDAIGPKLEGAEKAWLEQATQAI